MQTTRTLVALFAVLGTGLTGALSAQVPASQMDTHINAKLKLGDTTVDIVSTPGHSPGTLSYVFPVTDQGRTVMVAYSGGTLTGAFGTDAARWDQYIESQRRIATAAADANATVMLSNHSEYDNACTKARLVTAKREVGEEHPFVGGAAGVQRDCTTGNHTAALVS